jgi:hypothetical protein
MARLRVREVAAARDVSQTQLHAAVNKRLDDPIAMGTIRRYWYSSRDGKEGGLPIKLVDLDLLAVVAQVLGVSLCKLVEAEETEPGQRAPAPRAEVYSFA